MLEKTWKTKANYEIATYKDVFYFKFKEDEDQQKVLDIGHLFIVGRDIPKQLWTKRGISFIASRIGKPHCWVKAAQSQKRLDFAKVCIEVPIGANYPDCLRFKLRHGITASVVVEYMWAPNEFDGEPEVFTDQEIDENLNMEENQLAILPALVQNIEKRETRSQKKHKQVPTRQENTSPDKGKKHQQQNTKT
ncbi:hypothetical protein IFM89_008382 [Coptis chinensis]|uniref:DUF4283 domain-containing protein n=1 Tax=Coptis chinensis TaxID=261450 RepID=A0A835M598_9MAGN|nr:hypothetical protein IFM89_008382 [Coptis chinensis]